MDRWNETDYYKVWQGKMEEKKKKKKKMEEGNWFSFDKKKSPVRLINK